MNWQHKKNNVLESNIVIIVCQSKTQHLQVQDISINIVLCVGERGDKMYPFDGTEDEYCVRCKSRNKVDEPVCPKCGGTTFIFGWGIKPIHKDGEGFSCSCGDQLELQTQLAHGHAGDIHESYYVCNKCEKVFGTQIKIKIPSDILRRRNNDEV